MEYIEKRGSIYYAMQGDVKIDNVNFFNSRCNITGVGGPTVSFKINNFLIQWHTNFGYGSWSFGYAYVKFKGMQVRSYPEVDTTSKFVKILNEYVCIQDEEKDDIIIELANVIAHCQNAMDGSPYNSAYTSIPIEELSKKSITNVFYSVEKIKNENEENHDYIIELESKVKNLEKKVKELEEK